MIDDRLRSAAADLRVESFSRTPPPLRVRPRRLALIASGGLISLALLASVVLYSVRQDQPPPAIDSPLSSSSDTSAQSATTLPATSVSSSATTVTQSGPGDIQRVSARELSDFIGTYEIDYQDANVTLGQVGTSELVLEMTARSFCLRLADSSGCSVSADGTSLPTPPEGLRVNSGSSELNGSSLISLDIVAPDGVDLRVLDGDQAVCDLQRFPLTQFGTAVVWACQAGGPADHWELAATRDGRTLAAPVLGILSETERMADTSYFAVGDSIMLGAETLLEARGIKTVAESVNDASRTLEELQHERAESRISHGVVIQLGSDGPVSRQQFNSVLAEVSDVPRVVVLTVRAAKPWVASNNEIIRSLPQTHPNVVVLDWETRSTEVADHLSSDGAHLGDDVSRSFYSNLILEALGLPFTESQTGKVHSEEGTYVLKAGDYPSTVAARFKVEFADLLSINGWTIVDGVIPEYPPPGSSIRIPAGWTQPTTDTHQP